MGERKTKNDKAWEKLFEKHDILNNIYKNGFYEISADSIREFREPRLMAKFDHENNLPKIFRKNKLSILPLSTKSYIIGDFSLFEKINYDESIIPKQMSIPSYISTISPPLTSEQAALHCAYVTGMINDFMGEEALFSVSGKMGTGNFQYYVSGSMGTKKTIQVNSAQIEIDGGWESYNYFMLVEAKREKVKDFNIRQLFYPYRVWKNRTVKEIIPVFFTYSNDVFHFFEYKFEDVNNYNSLVLVRQKNYIVNYEKITQEDVNEVAERVTKFVPEPEVPFPQADDFEKVIDLLDKLYEEDLTKDDIAESMDFDVRQSDYYYNSCLYLGLANKYKLKDGVYVTLNDNGRKLVEMPYRQKRLKLAELILQHKVFKEVYDKFEKDGHASKQFIVERMKKNNLYNIKSEVTFHRRASTISGWVKWIRNLPFKKVN